MFPVLVVMMVILLVALVVALFMVKNGLISKSNDHIVPLYPESKTPKENDPFAAFSEELFNDEEQAKSEEDD